MQRLQGKVAIITGASGSIGRAVALTFAREGAALVLTSTAPSARGSVLLAKLDDLGTPVEFVPGDLLDEDTSCRVVDVATRTHDRLDMLVNNSGIDFHSLASETSVEDFDRVAAVNVRGTLLMTKHALPHRARAGGAIVNVASRLALVGLRGQAVYSGTKGVVVSIDMLAA